MTAPFETVTISSIDYDAYSDLATADAYLNADPTAEVYRALDANGRGRSIVSGTRVLDVQPWAGAKADEAQAHAWPRTGIVIDGVAVDPTIIPDDVVRACIELANASANGVDIANFVSTQATQRRFKAGSVEVENFRMPTASYRSFPLPEPAWLLIQKFMGGSPGAVGAKSFGTCGDSILDDGFDHTFGV